MSTKYRFSINGQSVNPIYKDDLSKDYELESQQRYYRAKLSGNLTFIRDDFDWIKAQAFQTEYVLLIERYLNGAWEDYWTGVFYKTDGKWDDDNKSVTVKLDVKDEYTEVLAGIENEYNLIKLSPAKTPLEIKKRPLIQLYIPGDSVVSCFLGGNYWEQDTAFEVESTSELINTYYFALASTLHKVFVSGIDGLPTECIGDYVAEGTSPTTFAGRNTYDISGEEIYKSQFESFNKYPITAFEHGKTSADLGSIWKDSSGNYWRLVAIPTISQLTFIQYFHTSSLPTNPDSLTYVSGAATNKGVINYTFIDTAVSSNLWTIRKTADDKLMFASKLAYDTMTDAEITFIADRGDNLFNRDTAYTTGYIGNSETLVSSTTFNGTKAIYVTPGQTYGKYLNGALDSWNNTRIRVFDNTGLLINTTASSVTIPSGAVNPRVYLSYYIDEDTYSDLTTAMFMDTSLFDGLAYPFGTFDGYKFTIPIYMRYLLDVDVISGLTTYDLPADDIVGDNRNYSRAIGYAIDQVTITANANVEATEYGIMDDGLYFVEPPGFPSYYKYFPVARSTWGYSSIWFNFDFLDETLETQGRKSYVMRDSMLISDVIKVLLAEIDPTISHDGTSDYSEFLYSDTNPITYGDFRVMITQKSNILAGEYDRPAQKAPTTLSEIMIMLRDTFQLYWYIENSMFKIEHVIWFKNGGSYSSSAVLTADLTTLESLRNKKKWGLYTSNYDYEKQDLAERMEFNWMDDVTEGFEGFPIEINSKFVQRGKNDTVSVSNFTTDVDYMLLNPSAINQDGFALFAAIYENLFKYDIYGAGYVQGYYGTDGETYQVDDDLWTTSYIQVVENVKYTRINGDLSYYVYAYDANQDPVQVDGTNVYWTDKFETIRIPDGVMFVKIVFPSANLSTFKVNSEYRNLPFIQRTINDADLRLQNGYMSWIYLHPNFWTYDLPASDVTINEDDYVTVYGIQRKKKQTVIYPSVDDPDPYKLIKTYLGNGQIDKLSINLSSRMNEIQLKYDTE